AAVLNALSPRAVAGRPTKEKWLLVHPSSHSTANDAVFRALGFSIIYGETRELLEYFGSGPTVVSAVGKVSDVPTKKMFPKEAVPRLGETPLRPVKEFFLGAPPEWSDIYSQTIHQTSHFTSAKNTILDSKNLALVGAPACGKSTLLMQLAAGLESKKRKLFIESLTPEKAENICATLAGEPCLIFVDNFADSFEGIEVLTKAPNVQVVGADRDFSFGLVSHRTKDLNFTISDVTELTEADLQKCVSSIPPALAVKGLLDTTFKNRPSLFEVIEANVNQPNLKRRFKRVLSELATSDGRLLDMLIMLCYVFSCRTPVSMDMLIAFCRNETPDWKEVASLRLRLGSMITEYFGEHAAADQDYFCPRSSHVAEAVLDVVPSIDLRRVLEQFHQEVSAARTCRFDLFRRKAFSADLFSKAFPDWLEGKAFYEKLVARDASPFLYQQAALYLSHKGRHSEAFTMIDLAITSSRGRVWSIRNSHAIILFRANIGFADQASARKSLKKSMDTLAECYKWDRRKAFHAYSFGQQAVQLWNYIKDTETEAFMHQAKVWLAEALVEEPWNRQCRYLLPQIVGITG
ncbi:MAG: hypothetical protein JWO95_308, partial [Verrucomicrobiales bacterium]|nr:hypothetical protein [Verrucomicrobiales bacterium]